MDDGMNGTQDQKKTAVQTTLSTGSTVKREKTMVLSCGVEGVTFLRQKRFEYIH